MAARGGDPGRNRPPILSWLDVGAAMRDRDRDEYGGSVSVLSTPWAR